VTQAEVMVLVFIAASSAALGALGQYLYDRWWHGGAVASRRRS